MCADKVYAALCPYHPKRVEVSLTDAEHEHLRLLAENVGLHPAPFIRFVIHKLWDKYQKDISSEKAEETRL